MCSNPLSTPNPLSTGQVIENEEEAEPTTPPRPVQRKSSLSAQSPRSAVQFDGTSASFHLGESSSTTSSTISSTTASSRNRTKKSVSFSSIHVQEHAVILGDNPAVQTGGPPVTMDWNCIRKYSMDLNEYEDLTGGYRRSVGELRMPAIVRQELLEGACNMGEMKRAAAEARKIKNQRQYSMAMAETSESVEVFCASLRRKVKRTWSGSRRKNNNSNLNQTKVDAAERWIEQQLPRTSRRATFSVYLVSRNTYRNSLRSSNEHDGGANSKQQLTKTTNTRTTATTTTTIADDDLGDGDAVSISSSSLRSLGTDDDEDAIIVAVVAQLTVTE